jgi:hypothetical protein
MKSLAKISWLALSLILLALTACGGGILATPTVDTASVYTQIAETALFLQTQTAQAASPTPSMTATPLITATPEITDTPTPMAGTPSVTPFSLSSPTSALNQQSSCDKAQFVTDVNYPDNAEVPAGSGLTKTWRLKNLGPCSWDKSYHLIFSYQSDGANWDKTPPVGFPTAVAPGETMDISVSLTAPAKAGTYRGTFRLQNSKGYAFGPEFYVQIVVK